MRSGNEVHGRNPLTDRKLRQPVRNPNTRRGLALVIAVATVVLIVNLVSSSGLGWFGWALFGMLVGCCVLMYLHRRLTVLEVRDDGVRFRNLFVDRHITWTDIDRFEIRGHGRRTLLLLELFPRRDVARVRLLGGATRRIWAVQPDHGYTRIGHLEANRRGDADDVVDALNWRVSEARGRPGSG
jgi:hypothetical protein